MDDWACGAMSDKWNRKIRVLATDDSQVMRSMFETLFRPNAGHGPGGLPEMELCGVARDGVECLEAVRALKPDVLLLDLEMPRMQGLEVLARLRLEAPMLPTVMCSTRTARGARATLDALALGAADYVTKPTGHPDVASAVRALAKDLLPKIAALAGWSFMGLGVGASPAVGKAEDAPTPGLPRWRRTDRVGECEIVAIGVSTGGPSALEQMLPRLPANFPVPVVIVQHMPRVFTGALAERLDRCCELRVREAFEGALLRPGTVWMAPGDVQMEVAADGRETVICLRPGDAGSQYRPAVDNLFASVARRYGTGTLALVMTGMGSDGLAGARTVHEAGGTVLVQDEATSAVWGMPARVAAAGIASAMVPLAQIAGELTRRVGRTREVQLSGLRRGVLRAAEDNHGLL